jgi:hypothetical protein
VVLLEIDATGFAILEFEGDAPRSIDVDRIARRIEPVQRVKVEAWDIHLFGSNGNVETVEPGENALCIFASIFELLPLAHNSERALLLKVRITPKM